MLQSGFDVVHNKMFSKKMVLLIKEIRLVYPANSLGEQTEKTMKTNYIYRLYYKLFFLLKVPIIFLLFFFVCQTVIFFSIWKSIFKFQCFLVVLSDVLQKFKNWILFIQSGVCHFHFVFFYFCASVFAFF